MCDDSEPLGHIKDEDVRKAIVFLIKDLDSREDDFEWDEESQTVKFCVPCSEHEFELDRATFLAFASECDAYKAEDDRFIRTSRRTLMLAEPVSLKAQYISCYQQRDIDFASGGGVTLHFHPVDPLVAIVAYKSEAYARHFYPPENYPSLEILYGDGVARKSPAEEERLFESFMFELAATEDLVFSAGCFHYDLEDNPFEELEGQVIATAFRPLEAFNEGMRLYLAACRAAEPELAFFSYYKVLEFFGPIALALEGNEAMRKKLDSPSALNPNADYLRSVFDLAKNHERRKNDKELVRVVLDTCIDFLDIVKLLPKPLSKELNYEDRKGVSEHARAVADALYATRNQVAHAKSNHQPQGNEVDTESFPQLNRFMNAAAVRTIRWYSRLPAHLKLTF